MKKIFSLNVILSVGIVIFLFVLSGCQSEGGEILPISGESVVVSSSRFENDTAQIDSNGLKMKLYGTWAGKSYLHLRIGFNNEAGQPVQINFERATIKNAKNQIGNLASITEKPDFKLLYSNGKDKSLPTVILAAGEKKMFNVEFASMVYLPDADETGRTFSFSLPVEVGGRVQNFNVQFKAIDSKGISGKSDPEDK